MTAGQLTGGLKRFEDLASKEDHLAVVVTVGDSATPHVAVVNVGAIAHPVSNELQIGFVSRPGPKLDNLRRTGTATLVARAGWEWIALSGPATLIGPDDSIDGITPERRRLLLREIFTAAGGTHPDLDRYDRVMADERRCAVLVAPRRFSANPPGAEHQEHDT